MGARLVRWFTYAVIFALLPLGTSVLIHYSFQKLTFDAVARSPELLFFSLMINATCLGEFADLKKKSRFDIVPTLIWSALLVGVVLSAILYGGFMFATVAESINPQFLTRVFGIALVLALFSLIHATLGQVFLAQTSK